MRDRDVSGAGRGWASREIGRRGVLLAIVIGGLGIIVGMTSLRGGAPLVPSDPTAVHRAPTAGGPVADPAPATPVTPVTPQGPSSALGTQSPAADGATGAATEPGAHKLPAAWCMGPMPLQAMARDGAGRMVLLAVDPVRCMVQLDGRRADGAAYGPIYDVSLYQPGFRPEGVRLADVGPDGRGWPAPTPLEGPLIGCPGEPGVSVVQVESAAGVEPLGRLCLGVCVPVASILADPERCSEAQRVAAQLSELPLLWDLVSLRGHAGPR